MAESAQEMKAEPTAGTRSRSRPDTEAGKHSVDESAAEIAELWQSYKERSTAEARERLILHYSPLVKFVAGRVAAGLPQNIEQSDLVSYGIFGLIDAIDKFDPGPRLQVRDLRDLADQGRDHRRAPVDRLGSPFGARQGPFDRARVLEARERVEAQPRRRARSPKSSACPRRSSRRCSVRSASSAWSRSTSSSAPVPNAGSGATVGDTIAGGGHDPVEAFESEEMRQVLADAINRMPDRERLVLTLYYYEGLTLAEIGNVLGVTESRVCQIHTKAIFQLRSRLSEPLPERGIVT